MLYVELVDAIFSVSQAVRLYFAWRPNLPDEQDNHIMELAIASGASVITSNTKDFKAGELHFPSVEIVTPAEFMGMWREKQWQR